MTHISHNLHHAIRIELHCDESTWRHELLKLTPEERRECVAYLVGVKARREVAKETKRRMGIK